MSDLVAAIEWRHRNSGLFRGRHDWAAAEEGLKLRCENVKLFLSEPLESDEKQRPNPMLLDIIENLPMWMVADSIQKLDTDRSILYF